MSAARPLSSLLSAGAVVAITLAAPGTALADPGNGSKGKDGGKAHGQSAKAEEKKAEPAKDKPATPAKEQAAKPKQAEQKPAEDKAPKNKAPKEKAPKDKPAADAPVQPAGSDAGEADPAGNNGTIKIDTVPADASRANRPHPGCAFTLKFFNFDAGQTADITFTGHAPTRSAGPLLTLTGQTISTTPADGGLEAGHSLVLSAADLGLIGTPTAAKGWHVKVAVDALEAPGGAKQKVFWLDCPAGEPAVVEEETDERTGADTSAGTEDQADDAALTPTGALSPVAADHALQPFGDGVVVLSESATRELTAEARSTASNGRKAASDDDATLAAAATAAGDDESSSVLPSVLPFTGAAGIAAMLAAGLGAVAAGALALRAGRRRSAEAGADLG